MPVQRILDFDTWRPGYGGATVRILLVDSSTLASVYTDEALSEAAANPQVLATKIENGISYGKFNVALYTEQAVELEINSLDQTGALRPPLTSLGGENASESVVTPTDASKAWSLANHLGRRIDVRDYGDFLVVGESGASTSTNTTTLTTAIGVASAAGGGLVEIPAGTYQVTSFTVPEGVVVAGPDREACILQSNEAGIIATIAGARAGFARLTLDGISQVTGSTGIYSLATDETILDHVEIKRFETGQLYRGGEGAVWHQVVWNDCVTGAKLLGDTDASNTEDGENFRHNLILGGTVRNCSTAGIILENIDDECIHNQLQNVRFDTNTGTALKVVGARSTRLENCIFVENTVNVSLEDGSPANLTNTVIDFIMSGGLMSGGAMDLEGTLENVAFERVAFKDVDITLTTPVNSVVALDCTEDTAVALAGTTTAWTRRRTIDSGASLGVTSGNAATKAWAVTPAPGERLYLEAIVVGRQRNGANDAFYHIAVSAERPPAVLNYDTQTANFTVGDIVTGQTSGASGRTVANTDAGATGSLSLQDVDGEFIDNETITDTSGGSAIVNGAAGTSGAALVGSVTAIRAAQETDSNWDATFVANGPEIEVQVTGGSGQTVEWKTWVTTVAL